MRRAAYFELRADYFGRQMDDGILLALLGAGYSVDVFAPDGELPQNVYPDAVRRRSIEYRRSWLQKNLGRRRWREYDLFLGTADLPMAFAGAIAGAAGRPVITVCDEIYIGGYEGHATMYWKAAAQWAMRRSAFTIITDEVRVPLQRAYASLPADHEFIAYPSCFARDYAGPTREEARRTLGITAADFVLSVTGAFTTYNGADWVVRLLDRGDLRALIQTGGKPDAVLDALLRKLPNAIYLPERLGFLESTQLTVAADAAVVFYLSPKPQFQAMGVSSQKLCTALWLGLPVIATEQPSFRFIEELACGALIDSERDLPEAVERIRASRAEYSANALRAVREFIDPAGHLDALTKRFAAIPAARRS